MQSRVGVIVPCFNQGRFAVECLASLRAQTFGDWRAVVVNDASTDDSLDYLRPLASAQIEIVSLDHNLGRALVRNEALRHLQDVEYVLNIDCDDRLTPQFLEKLVAALDAEPRAGIAYGTLHFFGSTRPGSTSWPSTPFVRERRYLENVIPGPGVLFRASALARTAGWRREFTKSSGEDWDIWLQIVNDGWEVLWVRDAIYEYRQHEQSFLAKHGNEATQVDVEINLLRHHAHFIRTSVSMRSFLSPRGVPALLAALRRGDRRRAVQLLRPLMRHAPLVTTSLLVRHYARRLRTLLRRA